MIQLPCENCITYAICKSSFTNTKEPYLKAYKLYQKCSVVRDCIKQHYSKHSDTDTRETSITPIVYHFTKFTKKETYEQHTLRQLFNILHM